MRTLTFYRHGITMGTPPSRNDHLRKPRGEVGGWSSGSTRRNIAFLRSVDPDTLICTSDGELLHGFAFTLTLRDCPPTSDDWHRLRKSLLERLRRAGMYRLHWVTEWQRRGVPHLHGAIWSPDPLFGRRIISHWLRLTFDLGTTERGQHCAPISDALGWFQYLSKHAARGVKHYQRSSENIPDGWQKTGRVWGYSGHWDLVDPEKIHIDSRTFFRMRRILRSRSISDARSSGSLRRLAYARSMLKCHDKAISETRGVSEWFDIEDQRRALDLARSISQDPR